MANLAGSCLGIISGFAGFRIKESGISIAPIVPKEIEGYRFKVHYLGSWLEIQVNEIIRVMLLHGQPVEIIIYNQKYRIEDEIEVERGSYEFTESSYI
jgi:alpha,alpha-trehalose phosphorylase